MTDEVTAPTTTIAPPAAPAPAPAPQPVPEPAPEPVKPKGKTEEAPAVEYEETGDPGLDFALAFVGRAGIDSDHPAMQAAAAGDFGLLKALLAQKGIAGWEQAVALGEQAVERAKGKATELQGQIQEAVAGVAEAVGVDWEAAVVWARENADEAEIEAINGLFQSPLTAKIAAHYIASQFAANAERPAGKPAVRADAGGAVAVSQTGSLTRIEFAQEAEKLFRQFGNGYMDRPEYKQLQARRAR